MERRASHEVDRSRYHSNKFQDYSQESAAGIIDPATKQIAKTYKDSLRKTIERTAKLIFESEKYWANKDDYSMYTGSGGIAYTFYKYGKYFSDSAYMDKAREMLQRCTSKLRDKRNVAFLTGITGPLALRAVISHSNGKLEESRAMISKLKDTGGPLVPQMSNDMPDELLYGRSGYLFALLFLNSNISPPPVEEELVKQVVAAMIESGSVYASARNYNTPLMYAWHGTEYLGGAHGLAGILYLLLQAREYLSAGQLENSVKPGLRYLQNLRYPSGNFPSSIGSSTDKLVHWCHGAPGTSMLFCLAYEVFGDEEFLETALQCGEVVWKRGIIKKGAGICHGITGNAYTFLSLYQLTKDAKHLYRACKFAEYFMENAGEYQAGFGDRPFSLMEGLAGPLYFLIDLQSPLSAKFPLYTI